MLHKTDDFCEFILDQLGDLSELSCKRMFGGYGFYQGVVFFAILHGGRLYFKTSEASRQRYIQLGMLVFRPSEKQTLKSYYQVPVDVLEDSDELSCWAKEAITVAASLN